MCVTFGVSVPACSTRCTASSSDSTSPCTSSSSSSAAAVAMDCSDRRNCQVVLAILVMPIAATERGAAEQSRAELVCAHGLCCRSARAASQLYRSATVGAAARAMFKISTGATPPGGAGAWRGDKIVVSYLYPLVFAAWYGMVAMK